MDVLNTRNYEEIAVPTSWGHIACKAWGDKTNEIVLVYHGIFDNAAAYDRLIPFLPECFYYICVDLPGHGKSGYLPGNLPLTSIDYLMTYKVIHEFFTQESYNILAHSYGAQLAMLFVQIYPASVKKFIMLDCFYLYPKSQVFFVSDLKKSLNYLTDTKRQNSLLQRTYTFEEALTRFANNRWFSHISREAAEPIVRRALIPTKTNQEMYTISTDPRLMCLIDSSFDIPYALKMLEHFPPPEQTLIILATESDFQVEYMQPIMDKLQTYKNITFTYVDGDHDVHNMKPELVGPVVSGFLLNQTSKL